MTRKGGLIRTDTGEKVTIAGPALPDGRVLVQGPTGLLEVVDVHQLTSDRRRTTQSDDV